MVRQRKRTIRLYRIVDDGRRILAGTLQAGSPAELVAGARFWPLRRLVLMPTVIAARP